MTSARRRSPSGACAALLALSLPAQARAALALRTSSAATAALLAAVSAPASPRSSLLSIHVAPNYVAQPGKSRAAPPAAGPQPLAAPLHQDGRVGGSCLRTARVRRWKVLREGGGNWCCEATLNCPPPSVTPAKGQHLCRRLRAAPRRAAALALQLRPRAKRCRATIDRRAPLPSYWWRRRAQPAWLRST